MQVSELQEMLRTMPKRAKVLIKIGTDVSVDLRRIETAAADSIDPKIVLEGKRSDYETDDE